MKVSCVIKRKMNTIINEAICFKIKSLFVGGKMATRQAIEQFLQQCEESIEFADQQYVESNKQEHHNVRNYTEAMQQLEQVYQELMQLYRSANDQQREQLHRARLRLQQMQNKMILLNQ